MTQTVSSPAPFWDCGLLLVDLAHGRVRVVHNTPELHIHTETIEPQRTLWR